MIELKPVKEQVKYNTAITKVMVSSIEKQMIAMHINGKKLE